MGLLQASAVAHLLVVAANEAAWPFGVDNLPRRSHRHIDRDGPLVASAGASSRACLRDARAVGRAMHYLLQRAFVLLQPQRRAYAHGRGQRRMLLARIRPKAACL